MCRGPHSTIARNRRDSRNRRKKQVEGDCNLTLDDNWTWERKEEQKVSITPREEDGNSKPSASALGGAPQGHSGEHTGKPESVAPYSQVQ